MTDSTAPPSDRRAGERHFACFPASLERPDGEQRPSLIRDLSETGVLLLVRTTKIAVGDKVKLQLYVTEEPREPRESGESADPRLAEGQVVRVEEVDPGDAGPWLRKVAVQFTGSITVTAEDIATFKERAMRLGIK
ncbi:MAG: PilZ domain-containing protein [Polyangiaceae bacterium]